MNELIADYSRTSLALAEDGVFTYSLSNELSDLDVLSIRGVYATLDNALDVSFVEVSENADISHYDWTDERNRWRDTDWGGIASVGFGRVRIFTRDTTENTGWYRDYLHHHEIGHALGMEHPFDDDDGDVWNDATTADTIMSYTIDGDTPAGYSRADWDTLTGLYGGTIPEDSTDHDHDDCETVKPPRDPHRKLNKLSATKLEKYAWLLDNKPQKALFRLQRKGLDITDDVVYNYESDPSHATFILNRLWTELSNALNG